jgi:Ca2+-binding RTX toxin-like protein
MRLSHTTTIRTTLAAAAVAIDPSTLADEPGTLAATATFANGTLTLFGDALANALSVGRDAAGVLNVNGGSVPIAGGVPTVDTTTLIQAFGQGGDDTLALDETNGPLPRANLFGGAGNDLIDGGSAGDQLFGQLGNDTLVGHGGADFLFGGSESDTLIGGEADDQVFGESGDDRLVWNDGDGSDLFEGGTGIDTGEIHGGDAAEHFSVTANGERVRIDRLDAAAPAAIDAGTMERLLLDLGRGDDRFSATGNIAALVQLSVDGGAGNDTILGGNGTDVLIGGEGDDTIDGNQGNDSIYLGAGDDRFVWSPGDGSDVVEGGAGTDTLALDGSNIGEKFDLADSGGWLLLTRDVGGISQLATEIETVELRTFGGADTVTVNDLAATHVRQVRVDLAPLGGQPADGLADRVVVHASAAADAVTFSVSEGEARVLGLPVSVGVHGAEAALDVLDVQLGGGDDQLNGMGLAAGAPRLVADGGLGRDRLTGSGQGDELHGGADDDRLAGVGGNDVLDGGEGNDRLVWNVGDGNDVFDGGAGTDTAEVNGDGAAEQFVVTANGERFRIDRLDAADPAFIDAGTLETLALGLGGGNDRFAAVGNVGALVQLVIDGGAGDDQINGGNGADLLTGGEGNDTIDGNQGSDTVLLGAGDDRFAWAPGDGSDVVEGGAGSDTLAFDGANIGEQFELSANGGRLRFTRDVATITLDADDMERLELRALGGADRITVNDLRGTDLKAVNIDLSASTGGGDGQADVVVINGSAGRDVVTIALDASGAVVVRGLAAEVVIRNFEPTLDRLEFNGLGGNDVVFAGGSPAVLLPLTLRGGEGNDVLYGGAGADLLDGGAGFDVLVGGPGLDEMVNGELQFQGLPTLPINLGF